MTPPTPASLMEEAKKLIPDHGYINNVPKKWKEIATALHSIQAQTIREMVNMINSCSDLCRCADYTCTGFCPAVFNAIISYAKDKGIEIV